MADNLVTDPGSGGATVATDEIGGVHYPRSKLIHGADGVNDGDVSSTNPLPVDLPNSVDSNNSSTSTLLSSATFTGTGTDVTEYGSLVISLEASHDSATDGVSIEFSTDNSNWDIVETFSYVAANGGRAYHVPVKGQFYRIRYTNGGTGQTHFRLESILHRLPVLPGGHRLSNDEPPENDGILVKSVLMAQAAGSGDFTNIDATAGGNLKVSLQEISDGLDVGAGNAGGETQRVSIATDDVNLSAITTAVQTIDNIVQAEDAVHNSGDSGVMFLGVRQDTQADFGADGDYVPLSINADGELRVTTNAAGGGTSETDDAAFTAGSGSGTPMMGFATSDSVNAGDVGVVGMSTDRRLLVDAQIAGQDADVTIADGGNSITVDGTVNVNLQDGLGNDISSSAGSLDVQIAGQDADVTIADGGNSITVDNSVLTNAHSADFDTGAGTDTTTAFGIAVPASGGAAVIPGDATAGLKVDLGADNDVTLATLPDTASGDLASIAGDAGTLAGAVSGTEMQVDLVAAPHVATEGSALGSGVLMQGDDGTDRQNVQLSAGGDLKVTLDSEAVVLGAGSASIGTLGANSGVDIGDVDVTSVLPGTGASNLGKAEDAVHATGDAGVAALAVRRDTAAVGSGTDGDYSTLNVDGSGRLWSHDPVCAALLTTIDADTSSLAGAVSGSEVQVDVVGSLPTGTNSIGQVTANAGTNLNTSALALESGGNLATLAGAVSGSEMQVDVVGSLPAGTNNIGDVDVASLPQPDSHYRNVDANAEDAIKGSAGTLYWIHAINLTDAVAYLHLYDATTASVTPGSTTPTFTFPIPAQSDSNGAGFNLSFGGGGHAFANAITLVVTTTIDGAAGDPGTNGVMVNAGYS